MNIYIHTQRDTDTHHIQTYTLKIWTHTTLHILLACVIGWLAPHKHLQHTNMKTYNRSYEFHTSNAENMPTTLAALLDLGSSRKRTKFDRNVSARMCCVRACMRVYLSRPHGRCTLDRHSPHACIEQIQIDTETEADTGAPTQCHTHHRHTLSRAHEVSLPLSPICSEFHM